MRDGFIRDWFPNGDEPARDPVKAARAAVNAARPKPVEERAETQEQDGAFVLTLDGRPARTPGRRPLAVPTRALGEALAQEWRGPGGGIGPATMPLTRMVNSTIDGVADDPAAVVNDVAKYAASDLVC